MRPADDIAADLDALAEDVMVDPRLCREAAEALRRLQGVEAANERLLDEIGKTESERDALIAFIQGLIRQNGLWLDDCRYEALPPGVRKRIEGE